VPQFNNNDEVKEVICSIKDITEIAVANRKREQLETAVNKLKEAVWIKSFADKEQYIFMGKACERITGTTQDYFYKNPDVWKSIILKEDIKLLKFDKDTGFISEGSYIVRIRNKDNNIRYISIRVFRTKDNHNQPLYYGIDRDITDEYLENKQLESLNRAINSSEQFIFTGKLNSDNYFILDYISNNIEKITYTSTKEARDDYKNFAKYVYHIDKRKFEKYLIDTICPKSLEYRVTDKKTGKIKWLRSIVNEPTPGKYFGIILDITDRKEHAAKYAAICSILDTAGDSIKIKKINSSGSSEFIYVNKATENIYGIPNSKWYNSPKLWKQYILPDDVTKEMIKGYKGCINNGEIRNKYRLKLDNNLIKFISESLFIKIIDDDTYLGCIQRDITDDIGGIWEKEFLIKILNNLDAAIKIKKSDPNSPYSFLSDGVSILYEVPKENFSNDLNYWRKFVPEWEQEKVFALNIKHKNMYENCYEAIYDLKLLNGKVKTISENFFKTLVNGEYYQCSIMYKLTK